MPLIQIRRKIEKFGGHFCAEIGASLPAVAAAAHGRIDFGDLTALLYAQGYKRNEFVSE